MLEPGCIRAFASELQNNPRAGCLGAKNLYPESRLIQHAGGFLDTPRMVGLHHGHNEPDGDGHHNTVREVQFVTGSSMFLRSAVLAEVGLFNEVFSPGYYEDVELCDRIRDHGWQVVFTPAARVLHHESASFSDEMARIRLAHRNRLIYLLPQLADPEFERDFISAETDFLEHHATFEEKRAVSGAALDLLVDLPRIIRRRLGTSRIPPLLAAAAKRVAVGLRTTCSSLLLPS
jgi:GT2 family glycosyltransferase